MLAPDVAAVIDPIKPPITEFLCPVANKPASKNLYKLSPFCLLSIITLIRFALTLLDSHPDTSGQLANAAPHALCCISDLNSFLSWILAPTALDVPDIVLIVCPKTHCGITFPNPKISILAKRSDWIRYFNLSSMLPCNNPG